MRYIYFLFILVANFFIAATGTSIAKELEIRFPVIADQSGTSDFYYDLLKTSLEDEGHSPKITKLELPQMRIKQYLEDGDIDLFWLVESKERNEKYLPIEVGLTQGLIGKRILLIRKGTQQDFKNVKSIEDFRSLKKVGAFGKNWFDVKVWKHNNLSYKEQDGNWKVIYSKLGAGRDFDYFSRGLNEIVAESKTNNNLEIEKNLALIYDRDFRFYMPKTKRSSALFPIISASLKKAQRQGTIDKLVKRHWAKDFESLNYDNRTKIHLATPK